MRVPWHFAPSGRAQLLREPLVSGDELWTYWGPSTLDLLVFYFAKEIYDFEVRLAFFLSKSPGEARGEWNLLKDMSCLTTILHYHLSDVQNPLPLSVVRLSEATG